MGGFGAAAPSLIDRARNLLIRGTIAAQRLAGAEKDVPSVPKPTLRQRLLSKRFELEDRVKQMKANLDAAKKQRTSGARQAAASGSVSKSSR